MVSNAFVEFSLPFTTQATVLLVDASGKTCRQVFSRKAEGQVLYKKELRLQGLAKGIYFVKLLTAEGKQVTSQILYR